LKKGFGLLITIVFVVVLSVIGTMILKFASVSALHTTRSFMDTRAELMLKSATEYAILAMHGHDYKNGCLNTVKINDSENMFDINVTYHYFVTDCTTNPAWNGCKCSDITTKDTNGSVLIYVTVKSKNANFHIRKVRFTLQNP